MGTEVERRGENLPVVHSRSQHRAQSGLTATSIGQIAHTKTIWRVICSQISIMTAERLLKTILVVDDDEMVRKLVVSTLKKSGYKTRVAADGKEAVFILKGISG